MARARESGGCNFVASPGSWTTPGHQGDMAASICAWGIRSNCLMAQIALKLPIPLGRPRRAHCMADLFAVRAGTNLSQLLNPTAT
jgi:hypothetical protein